MNLDSIQTGVVTRPPRVLLFGEPKVGKSTFAAAAPNAVVLPIKGEEGIDDLEVARFPTAKTFDDIMDALRELALVDKHPYRTVIIDSISALEPLLWEFTCFQKGWSSIEEPGFGRGYVEAAATWRKLTAALDHLRSLGIGSILIGHVITTTVNDPLLESYESWTPDVNKKANAHLQRWSDAILFAGRRPVIKKTKGSFGKEEKRAIGGDQRVLRTQARPAHPGGGRGVYGRLPYELPLQWPEFASAITDAQEQTSETETKANE